MEFVQIIEMQSNRFDEIEALHETWLAETEGVRTSTSELVVQDRDRPGTFLTIVRFPSVEAAEANNDLPATQRLAEAIAALVDVPMTFRNLDLVRMDS